MRHLKAQRLNSQRLRLQRVILLREGRRVLEREVENAGIAKGRVGKDDDFLAANEPSASFLIRKGNDGAGGNIGERQMVQDFDRGG